MKKLFSAILFLLVICSGVSGQDKAEKRILFFGDSITAGLGVSADQAFPALIEDKIDSLGWNFEVVNGGLSGETSAGGLRRIDWVMRREIDLFVLELGGNDGLRGIDLKSTRENLKKIIEKVRGKYPDARIFLAGIRVPPNLGPDYTEQFRTMYPEIAEEMDVRLIPLLLEGVGGNPEMMQGDGIHPNAKGHRKAAEKVWRYMRPVLEEMRQ
ncbi:MAG: arylesterase [Balneolaceae bacterium]|nr:arylesterase [Balneolaceae bacterium]